MGSGPNLNDTFPLPTDHQLLRSIREDLATKVAPELSTDMAKAVCRMAAQIIDYMLVRDLDWPHILQRQIAARTAILRDALALLERGGVSVVTGEASEILGGAPGSDASAEDLERFNRRQAKVLSNVITQTMDMAAAQPRFAAESSALIQALVKAEQSSEDSVVNTAKNHAETFSQERARSEDQVTHERLQAYLTQKFPDKNVKLTSLRELSGGFGKTTILFEVEGLEDKPSALVIRRDRKAGATEATVVDEYPVLEAVQGYDIPAPEPVWLEPDASKLGLPFLVVRRFPGKTAGSLWAPDKTLCSADTAKHLARIIAQLHKIPVEKVGTHGIWGTDRENAISRSIDYITDLWRRVQVGPDPVMDMALRWLALNQPPAPAKIVLVHSDIGFHNLLVDNERISGLLDWELSHPGDPNEDLCYVRPYVEQLMPWKDFVAEYLAAGGCEYLEDRTTFYDIWRDVRNTVFTALCQRGYVTDANTDIRFGHTTFCYYRMMLLDAARKISAL